MKCSGWQASLVKVLLVRVCGIQMTPFSMAGLSWVLVEWQDIASKLLPRGDLGYFGRAALIHGLSAVTAACLLIKKSIYLEVGGLNEADLQVAFNDVDFCLKVREAGYQNVWTPFAELYHHESATRGFEDTPEKQARFAKEVAYMKRTWGESLLNDPAYSPNLTLDHEDFSLAWPPA